MLIGQEHDSYEHT